VSSEADRKAALEVLRNAQFVFGLSRYPKKQVLDDPKDVKALRERLEAMRDAVRSLSPAEREKLDLASLDDIDSGSEAVWKAAKRATPKIITQLTPLVSDAPEAAFLIAPPPKKRGKGEPEPPPATAKVEDEDDEPTGLTGKELAGLELAIQQRAAADDAYFGWLKSADDLPVAEWKKRQTQVDAARRAADEYVEKLFKARTKS
jgi:hypothetical protein